MIRRARNFFKRLIKIKKQEWAVKQLKNAASNDIWKFQDWSKGIRNYPTPPISCGANIPKAITHQEKCDALRNELYQPPPALPTEFLPNLSDLQDHDMPFIPITESEIEEAIANASSKLVAGFSQIS